MIVTPTHTKTNNTAEKVTPECALIITNYGILRAPFDDNGDILPSVWLDEKDILQSIEKIKHTVNKSISTNSKKEKVLYPANVLLDNDDCIVFYSESNTLIDQWYVANTGNIHVRSVPHPQLVFFAGKKNKVLLLAATSETKRPTLETRCFHAPLANIYQAGNLCLGNATLPIKCNVQAIDEIQDCLFGSKYTSFKHRNIVLEENVTDYSPLDSMTVATRKSIEFWQSLIGKTEFPLNKLIESNEYKNVSDFIDYGLNRVGGTW